MQPLHLLRNRFRESRRNLGVDPVRVHERDDILPAGQSSDIHGAVSVPEAAAAFGSVTLDDVRKSEGGTAASMWSMRARCDAAGITHAFVNLPGAMFPLSRHFSLKARQGSSHGRSLRLHTPFASKPQDFALRATGRGSLLVPWCSCEASGVVIQSSKGRHTMRIRVPGKVAANARLRKVQETVQPRSIYYAAS